MSYDSIILSGGGTKGFCTLGALQYIYDNNLLSNKVNHYIGTSVGSIISYLLAIGFTPIEIVVYICSNNVFENLLTNFSQLSNLWSGIYDYSSITKHCENMTLTKLDYIPTLKQLKDNFDKELIICSYNLTKHKREYISYLNYPDLSCLQAIRMSSSIPFIFNECINNSDEYIDGGVIDNYPINILKSEKFKNTNSIGINLDDFKNSDLEEENNTNYGKILKLINKMYNIIMIPTKENKEYNIEIDTITINTSIKFYNFSISHTKKLELFSYGYNCAKHYFDNKILMDTLPLRNL
jgi:predicted acylesterase/phospholipase RssA